MHSPRYESPIHCYGDPALPALRPATPLNALFLTSVRDTGCCDKNGSIIRTKEGLRYMEGAIERTVKETREGGRLHDILRIVGVVNDDLEKDVRDTPYPVRPSRGRQWVFSEHLRNSDDSLVIGADTSHWIPSTFRALPPNDIDGRRDAKLQFERQVAQLMEEKNADILISDHYMARIEHLVSDTLGKFGRVLNIHPAVTIADHPHCFRGKTPTADAIERARSGEPTMTGATLHIMDEEIDHGPALAYMAQTPVFPDDAPQELRYRNYQAGKLPLFIAGMRHYIERIYPHLDRLDLYSLSPLDHERAHASV